MILQYHLFVCVPLVAAFQQTDAFHDTEYGCHGICGHPTFTAINFVLFILTWRPDGGSDTVPLNTGLSNFAWRNIWKICYSW